MKPFAIVIGTFGLVATLAPVPASAQQSISVALHPELTKEEFETFASEVGSVLRFRQLGDTTTLGRGNVDVSVQFASTPIGDANHYLGRASFPRIVGRFGVNDRVDIGAWGGFDPDADYGLVGVDTKIALLKQGPSRPVSVSIRPSITSLVGVSEVWVGNASVDLAVSRAFGPVSPYAGVAASSSLAVEWSKDLDLAPASAGSSLAYAGLSYRWRALSLSAEMEKGTVVSYALRIGTRF